MINFSSIKIQINSSVLLMFYLNVQFQCSILNQSKKEEKAKFNLLIKWNVKFVTHQKWRISSTTVQRFFILRMSIWVTFIDCSFIQTLSLKGYFAAFFVLFTRHDKKRHENSCMTWQEPELHYMERHRAKIYKQN